MRKTARPPKASQAPAAAAPLAQPRAAAVAPEAPSPCVNAPSWVQTLRMILWAGVVLGVCSLLWLFWTQRMLLVFSGAAVIWACFALAAVFDHLCRRLNPED